MEENKNLKLPENAHRKLEKGEVYKPLLPADKTFPEVTTIGQAAEKLLELGATAEQLRGNDGIIDTMLEFGVVFPNLTMR